MVKGQLVNPSKQFFIFLFLFFIAKNSLIYRKQVVLCLAALEHMIVQLVWCQGLSCSNQGWI